MSFTDDQMARIRGTMQPVGACSLCGTNEWHPYENFVALPEADPQSLRRVPDTAKPLLVVRCWGCGHVLFFDAERVGLL